jgi:diguanylate cyclase (GGDEF)-like protein/PAS domain S-box-containing protein
MRRRAWLLYLTVGVAALSMYLFVPGLRQGWLFNLIALSSPIAIIIAVRDMPPEDATPWYLFALGQAFFVAGDLIAYNYELFLMRPLPFPSSADALYLSVYPCLIAGILLLVRRRNPGHDRESVTDSLIVAIGVGVISWAFLMAPTAQDTDASLFQKLVSVSYPFMDLFLLTAVVRLVIGPGRRGLAFYLLPTAALFLFLTDFATSYQSVRGVVYDRSGYLEVGSGLFYLLWGAAALHLSRRHLSEPAPDQEVRVTRMRLAMLGAALLVPQAVREVQEARGHDSDLWMITISTMCLFVLAISRMSGLVGSLKLSFRREKALRNAGAALVTATNRDEIHAAAMRAVATLVPDGSARLLIRPEPGDTGFAVIAASKGSVGLLGMPVEVSDEELRLSELIVSGVVRRPMPRLAADLHLPPESTSMLALPLVARGELGALIVIGTVEELPRAVADGLETLASQVSLALESAALTEGAHKRQSEARFTSLVQHASDVTMVVDADSRIRYASPSVERVLGATPAELEGTMLVEAVHPEDRASLLQFLTIDGDATTALAEYRMRHPDDRWLHVETIRTNLLSDENVRGIVLNTRDVSERKAFEEQLAHQAFHDSVTGLANRALFRDRVEHSLERQSRDHGAATVLLMDLDDFKTVNDSLGHAAGDRLLTDVGERLKACLRQADTAARLGGDEFAVLLEDGGEGIQAAEVASRILAAFEEPFVLDDKEVLVRTSIGIASADPMSQTAARGAEELLRNADVAMYMAKEAGKGRYQLFEPAMHDTALKRLELKADLQRALDNEEFIVHYQPVIELESGRIQGLEALMRWQHPVRGTVPPLDFIPIAEETGLIVPIGNWVLREACQRAIELQARYKTDPPLHMAVNLSARQLQRPEVVSDVALALMDSGLDPSLLVLEITETVMMQDIELSTQRLTELKELGVKLAVDDFGTGYSSLNYIRRFPVDILKVDKSFVDGVTGAGEESALAAAIIELAAILRLRPVAEGIERADQLEKLLSLSCDLGQGYYFARPLPLDAVDDLLTARRSLAERESELSS